MHRNDDERAERIAELCQEALGHAEQVGSFRLRFLIEMALNELAMLRARSGDAVDPRAEEPRDRSSA